MKDNDMKLKKVLKDMSYSLNHIEDIMADDREILVNLVKQNNTIVEFLKQIEIDEVTEEYEDTFKILLSEDEEKKMKRLANLKEVLDEFVSKRKDLIEFEEELKKLLCAFLYSNKQRVS